MIDIRVVHLRYDKYFLVVRSGGTKGSLCIALYSVSNSKISHLSITKYAVLTLQRKRLNSKEKHEKYLLPMNFVA